MQWSCIDGCDLQWKSNAMTCVGIGSKGKGKETKGKARAVI